MLTVLTWLWNQPGGRTKFCADHVNIWADMVSRNLAMPHRIACVTDIPDGIDARVDIIPPPGEFIGVETPTWSNGRPNCFRRLAMFRRDAAQLFGAERFVSMDLDCVIGGDLDPLFDRREDLVLFKGTTPERPYNGSMMLITAGCRPKVYEKFTAKAAVKAGAIFKGSDQSWLAYQLGWREAVWTEEHGVQFWGTRYRELRRNKVVPRVLFFPGKLKPWTILATKIDRYVGQHYHRDVEREAA